MVELHTLVEDQDSSVSSVNQTMNAFELTMTQGFQGLKVRQTEIAIRVRTCTHVYNRLKDIELDPEDPKSAEYVGQIVEYNDDRHDSVSMIKAFYAASGQAINANHQGDAKASMRRARSVVKLIEFWRAMLMTTDFLQRDEDDKDDDNEDNLWVGTPTPRNMADLVTEVMLKIVKEGAGPIAEATEKTATPTMSMMDKVAHEPRSVEVRECLTPTSKSKPKGRKGDHKEISPIRSSTPTPIQMTEVEREREDKVMERGSSGKKKTMKKGKGTSPRKTLAEEERGNKGKKNGSTYETKAQAGRGVIAIRQTESDDEEQPTGGKMKIQIFEKDEETEKMLEKLKREQLKLEDMKRKADLRGKKLKELQEQKEHMEKKKGLAFLLEETKKAQEEQEEAMKKAEEEIELLEEEEKSGGMTTPVREKNDWTDQKSKSQEKRERKEKKEKEEARERKKDREETEKKRRVEKKERDQEYLRNLEETIRKRRR